MLVRDLRPDDLSALAALYHQFWGEESNVEKMQAAFPRLAESGYILLCAEERGVLAGSVMGIVCGELYGNCDPFLVVENMIVDADCRRRGVGKALFAELERRARARGCAQAILVTESDRGDAIAFYQSAGFSPDANRGFKKKL